jgi:predicted alpha-1,6-mannanase (GH76 family)
LTVSLEFWHLILLCMSFFGFVGGCAKVLLNQINKGLDARFLAMDAKFLAQDEARKAADKEIKEAIAQNSAAEKKNAENINKLEISFLKFTATLPTEYVRHPDYVRQESKIESKLDALYNILTRRGRN